MNVEGVTWSMGATPFIYDLLGAMERTGNARRSCASICAAEPRPRNDGSQHGRRASYYVKCTGPPKAARMCTFRPPTRSAGTGKFSGRPFKGIEVRVVDEQGRDVPTGMQGEELSRGPNVFVGYLGNPEATDEALSSDGWFASGDLCSMDDRGRIRINGRRKEIIIRGGENISAAEVTKR